MTGFNDITTSDHCGFFLDLSRDVLLKGKTTSIPSPFERQLKSNSPKSVRKYKNYLKQQINTNGIQAHWPNQVRSVTGGSDSVSLLVAHSIRNLPRYDGEVERSIVITIKLYNITPVVISDSLRLDLNILEENIEDTTMISSNERKFDLCLNDEIRTPHIILPPHSFLKVTTTYNNT